MEKLKTATGKEFNCDYFNPFPPAGQVNLRVIGISVVEAATIFGNPSETMQLYYGSQYLAQHTNLVAIIPEGDAIRVVLGRS